MSIYQQPRFELDTPISIADGGTGATNATSAKSNLSIREALAFPVSSFADLLDAVGSSQPVVQLLADITADQDMTIVDDLVILGSGRHSDGFVFDLSTYQVEIPTGTVLEYQDLIVQAERDDTDDSHSISSGGEIVLTRSEIEVTGVGTGNFSTSTARASLTGCKLIGQSNGVAQFSQKCFNFNGEYSRMINCEYEGTASNVNRCFNFEAANGIIDGLLITGTFTQDQIIGTLGDGFTTVLNNITLDLDVRTRIQLRGHARSVHSNQQLEIIRASGFDNTSQQLTLHCSDITAEHSLLLRAGQMHLRSFKTARLDMDEARMHLSGGQADTYNIQSDVSDCTLRDIDSEATLALDNERMLVDGFRVDPNAGSSYTITLASNCVDCTVVNSYTRAAISDSGTDTTLANNHVI